MHTNLAVKAFFVVLMTFVMGWSSIASAMLQPVHDQMMEMNSDSMLHVDYESTPTLKHEMSNCHDSGSMMQSIHHSDQLLSSKHIQHDQCLNCAQWHCQNLITYIDTASFKFDPLMLSTNQYHIYIYASQHLNGYWQEILRPPKA